MMGRERKCHSIKEHQTYIKVFVPKLGGLFNTDGEEELSLLRLLDEAYITTRYQNNYHINEVQIQKIRGRAEQMFVLVSRLFEDKLAKCQNNGKNITNRTHRASRLNRASSGIFPGGFRQIILGVNITI